jgi:hypothetical protein
MEVDVAALGALIPAIHRIDCFVEFGAALSVDATTVDPCKVESITLGLVKTSPEFLDSGASPELVVLDVRERHLVVRPSMRQYGVFGLFSGAYALQASSPGIQETHFVERNCDEISKRVCSIVCFHLDPLFRTEFIQSVFTNPSPAGAQQLLGSRLSTPREYAPITAMATSEYTS